MESRRLKSLQFLFGLRNARLLVAHFLLIGCIGLHAQTYEYKIGERVIHLPTPKGFEMSLGLNSAYDQFLRGLIGSNILTYFTDPEAHALLLQKKFPGGERVMFSATYSSETENVDVSEQSFKDLISQTKQEIGSSTSFSDAVKSAKNSLDGITQKLAGVTSNLQVGEPIRLGIFEESANTLVFGIVEKSTLNSQHSGGTQTFISCVIVGVNRVADRLLFLYCSVPYRSAEDIKYALSIFKPWRDETLNLNANSD